MSGSSTRPRAAQVGIEIAWHTLPSRPPLMARAPDGGTSRSLPPVVSARLAVEGLAEARGLESLVDDARELVRAIWMGVSGATSFDARALLHRVPLPVFEITPCDIMEVRKGTRGPRTGLPTPRTPAHANAVLPPRRDRDGACSANGRNGSFVRSMRPRSLGPYPRPREDALVSPRPTPSWLWNRADGHLLTRGRGREGGPLSCKAGPDPVSWKSSGANVSAPG